MFIHQFNLVYTLYIYIYIYIYKYCFFFKALHIHSFCKHSNIYYLYTNSSIVDSYYLKKKKKKNPSIISFPHPLISSSSTLCSFSLVYNISHKNLTKIHKMDKIKKENLKHQLPKLLLLKFKSIWKWNRILRICFHKCKCWISVNSPPCL